MGEKPTSNTIKWTAGYVLINVLYFAVFCSVHGYAAVILLDRGFSNGMIGVTLCIANILSAVGQPLVAGIVDKSKVITNRRVIIWSSVVLIGAVVAMLFVRDNKALILVIFAFIYALQFMYQSNMIAMNFEYQRAGCDIKFGLARGLGSAGFAVSSAILGGFVERNGADVLLYFTIAALTALIIVTFLFKKPDGDALTESAEEEVAGAGFFEFFKKYRSFMLLALGTAFCYFSHNMLNDYLIQIVRSLGGGETQLGYATFLSAILELPVMALIGIVLKRIRANKILIFAAAAFVVKNVIMLLAADLFGMYLSQACQLFAYAVFIPTSAYYADTVMEACDKVKGQAFINSAITLGGVFSSLICGKILDVLGVKAMLVTGSGVAVAGLIVIALAVGKEKGA